MEPIDICIVTYNRLPYLQNCIWSIIASTKIPYRLFVISDNSSDGTNEWLIAMEKHGKINKIIINETNIGSASSFNKIIDQTSSEYFVMTCDDIWFHRGWDSACVSMLNEFKDCGIVTFFNIPQIIDLNQPSRINDHAHKIQLTGLGASMINRNLFIESGKFILPKNIKMGFFARGLCRNAAKTKLRRKYQYITVPIYAEQMDRNNPADSNKPEPKLAQEYLFKEYNVRRAIEKNKFKSFGAK